MKKTNNNFIKIEDCVVRLVRVEGDFVIFELTGREQGFKTTFKISKSQVNELGCILSNASIINAMGISDKIVNIHAKHREYTMTDKETCMSYKYYESRNCEIHVVSRGGYAIVCLRDNNDNVYRTVAFRVQKYADQFKKMARMIKDASMHQF